MSASLQPVPSPPVEKGNILRWCSDVWAYLKRSRVVPGSGIRAIQTANGLVLSSSSTSSQTDSKHPFQISAYFDDNAAPTVCLVRIHPGRLSGVPSPDDSYLGKPIFEGSTGAELDSDPVPEYDIGVTEGRTYFYFVVTTDNQGLIKTVWIEAIAEADVAAEAVDVPYVQEDFPAVGDPGSDGVYYHEIGYAEIVVTGTAPNFVTTVETMNDGVRSSLMFFTCGGAGFFVGQVEP